MLVIWAIRNLQKYTEFRLFVISLHMFMPIFWHTICLPSWMPGLCNFSNKHSPHLQSEQLAKNTASNLEKWYIGYDNLRQRNKRLVKLPRCKFIVNDNGFHLNVTRASEMADISLTILWNNVALQIDLLRTLNHV